MKQKTVIVLGVIALVLAFTSGAFATSRWIITKSSQVKPGAISYNNLSKGAKKKLRGAPGSRALLQFDGQVNHGQTWCLGAWGSTKQGVCLGAAYASDTNS